MNASTHIEEDASDGRSEVVVGVVYLLLSVTTLVFNLTIQLIISRSQDLNSPAYRIMLHLGLCCCLQVLAQAFAGIFSVAHSTLHHWIVKILGGLLNSAWVASIAFTLLLAFNRFVVVCFPQKADIYFSRTKLTLMIGAFWIWPFGSFFLVYMTPFTSMLYFVLEFRWGHDGALWSATLEECEVFSIIAMILLCAVFYIPVFYKLLMMKRKHLSGRVASLSERRVLFQGMSIFGYNFLLMFAFGAHKFLFPETKWTFFGVNTLWILNAAINPVLYLIFNKAVRTPFLHLVTCRRPAMKRVRVVAQSTTRTNQTLAPN
ncbi:hypothetical protein QR680_004880 [Steinernema hermaphroditum]|uniref:G-protein coupled receptors family 1 profile domain-containing protein n=1 Tax=Steinernema hermaphroditum TaxID=289476 RepID=A0AA39LUE0_9BILA|nr:hypothetical protein QR680_004880 [Steinernema hermaphroditum]